MLAMSWVLDRGPTGHVAWIEEKKQPSLFSKEQPRLNLKEQPRFEHQVVPYD
jgi:hypothetical protein